MILAEGETKCGEGYEKSYYVAKNIKAYWSIAAGICKSFELEFLSLETEAEASELLQLCSNNSETFDQHTHIGGITTSPKSLDEWYWINSYNRIDYPLRFRHDQPNNYGGDEFCLSLQKEGNNFEFNDIKCYESWREKFICQHSSLSAITQIVGHGAHAGIPTQSNP